MRANNTAKRQVYKLNKCVTPTLCIYYIILHAPLSWQFPHDPNAAIQYSLVDLHPIRSAILESLCLPPGQSVVHPAVEWSVHLVQILSKTIKIFIRQTKHALLLYTFSAQMCCGGFTTYNYNINI